MVISAHLSNQSIFDLCWNQAPLLRKHLIFIQIFTPVIVTYSTTYLEAILFELQLNTSIFGGHNTYCWRFDNSMMPSFLVDHDRDRITYHHLLVSLNGSSTSLHAMACCDKSSTATMLYAIRWFSWEALFSKETPISYLLISVGCNSIFVMKIIIFSTVILNKSQQICTMATIRSNPSHKHMVLMVAGDGLMIAIA